MEPSWSSGGCGSRGADMRLFVESLSQDDLLALEACLERAVRSGTASLADFGRLAYARSELARRNVKRD